VHADRIAQGARAAAGQIVDPARRRDPDSSGIEQQQIGTGANRSAAAVGDAESPAWWLVSRRTPSAMSNAPRSRTQWPRK
jgi:hypothetical protein